MTDTDIAPVIRDDDLEMIKKCRAVEKGFPKRGLVGRMFDSLLRALSPLL